MRNFFWLILIVTSLLIFSFAQCKKDVLPEFYFRCKVDGQDYRPNGCTNCITCTILGDTIFLLGGNRGFETLGMGIRDLNGITKGAYNLNEIRGRKADYKNSIIVDDRYFTDANHVGKLEITSVDKQINIISGTFFFNAYNSYRRDTVIITEGKFRLKYTTN